MMEIRTCTVLFALIAIFAGFAVRATDALDAPGADPSDSDGAQPLRWLKAGDYASLDRYYSELQRRYESGSANDQKLYGGFRKLYEDSAANERYFDGWVEALPTSYPARVARGAYLYRMAWFVRGDKYINKTPREQVIAMSQYLERAQPDLLTSVKMTAKPFLSALYLLNVAMLEGSADERRKWFDEGTRMDPGGALLRTRYMFSLRPRWGGSYAQMEEFLQDCERQHLDPKLLAGLSMQIHADMAEDAMQADADAMHAGSTAEVFNQWEQVLKLAEIAGQEPSTTALVGYTRSAFDLHRRADADRGLEQLAKRKIDDSWSLERIGWVYAQEHRDAQAWPFLLKAAELNEPWSQFVVGKTIYQGCPDINVAPDQAAGLAWIRRAANQCHQEAITFLSSHNYVTPTGCSSQTGPLGDLPARYFTWWSRFVPWDLGGGLAVAVLTLVLIKRRRNRPGP